MSKIHVSSPAGLLKTSTLILGRSDVANNSFHSFNNAVIGKYLIPLSLTMFPSTDFVAVTAFGFGDTIQLVNTASTYIAQIPLSNLNGTGTNVGVTAATINQGTYTDNLSMSLPLSLFVVNLGGSFSDGVLLFVVSYFEFSPHFT